MVRDAGADHLRRGPGVCHQEVAAPQPRRLPQGLAPPAGACGETGTQPHPGGQHIILHFPRIFTLFNFRSQVSLAALKAFHEMVVGAGAGETEDNEEETSR